MPGVMPPETNPSPRRRAAAPGAARGEVLKLDGRSRVWIERDGPAPRVVKRFEAAPRRQRLRLWLGLHPAQQELRWNRRLRRMGVPVVPVIAAGHEPVGLGTRAWLATPWWGDSLHHRLRAAAGDAAAVERLLDAAAPVIAALAARGLRFRDLKPSNIVIDEQGRAALIDVGGMRRGGGDRDLPRMLEVLERRLERLGVDADLRRRLRGRLEPGLTRTGAER